MRKNPVQKKAQRKVEQRRAKAEKEKREQKRRMLLGLETKNVKTQRLNDILNKIGVRKAV